VSDWAPSDACTRPALLLLLLLPPMMPSPAAATAAAGGVDDATAAAAASEPVRDVADAEERSGSAIVDMTEAGDTGDSGDMGISLRVLPPALLVLLRSMRCVLTSSDMSGLLMLRCFDSSHSRPPAAAAGALGSKSGPW
jgi:hypothetical protein